MYRSSLLVAYICISGHASLFKVRRWLALNKYFLSWSIHRFPSILVSAWCTHRKLQCCWGWVHRNIASEDTQLPWVTWQLVAKLTWFILASISLTSLMINSSSYIVKVLKILPPSGIQVGLVDLYKVSLENPPWWSLEVHNHTAHYLLPWCLGVIRSGWVTIHSFQAWLHTFGVTGTLSSITGVCWTFQCE